MNKTIFKDFSKYVSFNILGQIAYSCYTLADTFFVSADIGTNGLTALNLAFPVFCIISGTGLMIGIGGSSRFSILKSRNESNTADQVFTNGLILVLLFASIFFFTGLFASQHLVTVLGADIQVFETTNRYLKVLMLFAPAFLLNHFLQCFVRNDGNPSLSMAAMITGSFSNIVLDYIFIFSFGHFRGCPCNRTVTSDKYASIASIFSEKKEFFSFDNSESCSNEKNYCQHPCKWYSAFSDRSRFRCCDVFI